MGKVASDKLAKIGLVAWTVLAALAAIFDLAFMVVTGCILSGVSMTEGVLAGILGFGFAVVNFFLASWPMWILLAVIGVVLVAWLVISWRRDGKATPKMVRRVVILSVAIVVVTMLVFLVGYGLQANYFAGMGNGA